MNERLGSGDETLMPLLAGWGSQPDGDDSGIGGTFGGGFLSASAIERVARIAKVVIARGSGGVSDPNASGYAEITSE